MYSNHVSEYFMYCEKLNAKIYLKSPTIANAALNFVTAFIRFHLIKSRHFCILYVLI